MKMVDPMIMEVEQEGATTRRMLERVPDDKLDWRPHARSRTLGQLAMHVAVLPGNLAEIAHMDTFPLDDARTDIDPVSVKEILEAHDASIANAKKHIGLMDDAKAVGIWTGTLSGRPVFTVPRIGLMRTVMLNHWYHHRGQLSVYLRELDVPVPAIYGASADEDPFLASTGAGTGKA